MIKRAISTLSVIFTLFFLILASTPAANYAAGSLTVSPRLKKADIIVVLGGGAYENGVLNGASNERFIQGVLLYKEGLSPFILFSGGSIKSYSKKIFHTLTETEDAARPDVVEASIMKDTAEKIGIPRYSIHVDTKSTNTYTNLKTAGYIMEKRGLKTCLLVSSPAHMKRAMKVSEKLKLNCFPAPVKDYTWERSGALDRVSLFREAAWEYAALFLYRAYGYI